MTMTRLFEPLRIGAIPLANRVVMAPLTRNRAVGTLPNALMARYYAQRADAGLIVTEASQISPQGQGYLDTPGIYSAEQVAAWRQVTDAVHARGGRIVIQLWHVGRISHVSLQPGGVAPVSSTARAAIGAKTYTAEGFVATSTPRALRTDEMPGIVADYRHAARSAIAAGFDGIEVHAANGYLIDQFLRDSINDRTDAYGASIGNRCRLLVEVMTAVAAEIGADRTGLRLSPVTPVNGAGQDSDAKGLFGHAVRALAPLKLAFLHLIEGQTGGPRDLSAQGVAPFDYAALRREFGGACIVNNGYTREMAIEAVESGAADAVAFGKPFIANPDLVLRLQADAPLNRLDTTRLYGGGEAGYTDYPALETAPA
jgi:N-ethylmaleimide reductase